MTVFTQLLRNNYFDTIYILLRYNISTTSIQYIYYFDTIFLLLRYNISTTLIHVFLFFLLKMQDRLREVKCLYFCISKYTVYQSLIIQIYLILGNGIIKPWSVIHTSICTRQFLSNQKHAFTYNFLSKQSNKFCTFLKIIKSTIELLVYLTDN